MSLNIKDIEFDYGKKNVLKGIGFSCNRGEVISIVGPNGSGKTTFLKCINRILEVKNGGVTFEKSNILGMEYEDVAKKIAYVPQMLKETFSVPVIDVIMMGRTPHIRWKVSDDDLDIVINIMKEMKIDDLAREPYSTLSGGQRQKVLIARALAQETDIYLLDEPISFLDIKNQIEVMKLTRKVAKEDNKIVVMVIHDLNMAKKYSDKILLMDKGQVVDFGASHEVLCKENIKKVYDVDVDIINEYIIPL